MLLLSRKSATLIYVFEEIMFQEIVRVFSISTGLIAFSEIGDKTQLLSLVLALKYKKKFPIIWGMFIGFFLNHALAAIAGNWLMKLIGPLYLAWILFLSFTIMGGLMLIPEKDNDDEVKSNFNFGPVLSSVIAFFIAETGDKTQLTTIALALKYDYLWTVIWGTTFGMMLVNVPVVIFSENIEEKIPMKWIKLFCAAFFIGMGLVILFTDILKMTI
jgi:putative Ca2+/H+ antiporter (TMEM165/GDT1 family)